VPPAFLQAAGPAAANFSKDKGIEDDINGSAANMSYTIGSCAAAPLPALLDSQVGQRVMSQYRSVSKACVRYCLDELRILDHLLSLRRAFFMEAGDWGDALVGAAAAEVDGLRPLTQAGLQAMAEDAVRVSWVFFPRVISICWDLLVLLFLATRVFLFLLYLSHLSSFHHLMGRRKHEGFKLKWLVKINK
jgi:hypothetical protein